MAELIGSYWLVLVIALVIGIIVAWWVFVRSRRAVVETEPEDTAAPGAPPRRNQALIDAPPAAAPPPETTSLRESEEPAHVVPPVAPTGFAGVGVAVEAAAEPAPAQASPEPGPDAPAEQQEPPPPGFPVPPDQGMNAVEPAELDSDLTRIKGLGPKLVEQLRALGVTSLAQIAAWDEAEIDRIDPQLGRFQGRIRRDQWPEQARLLVGDDQGAYEERFGKL